MFLFERIHPIGFRFHRREPSQRLRICCLPFQRTPKSTSSLPLARMADAAGGTQAIPLLLAGVPCRLSAQKAGPIPATPAVVVNILFRPHFPVQPCLSNSAGQFTQTAASMPPSAHTLEFAKFGMQTTGQVRPRSVLAQLRRGFGQVCFPNIEGLQEGLAKLRRVLVG